MCNFQQNFWQWSSFSLIKNQSLCLSSNRLCNKMQLEKNSRCKLRGKKLLEKYFHPPTGIKKIVINLKKMVLIITIMIITTIKTIKVSFSLKFDRKFTETCWKKYLTLPKDLLDQQIQPYTHFSVLPLCLPPTQVNLQHMPTSFPLSIHSDGSHISKQ